MYSHSLAFFFGPPFMVMSLLFTIHLYLIFQAVRVPVLANGDVRSLADAAQVRDATGVDGVMCARGMLENPAMFAGEDSIACANCRIAVTRQILFYFCGSITNLLNFIRCQGSTRRPPSAYPTGCGSRSTPARPSPASITTWDSIMAF